jgi:hypothetical protein
MLKKVTLGATEEGGFDDEFAVFVKVRELNGKSKPTAPSSSKCVSRDALSNGTGFSGNGLGGIGGS